MKIVMDHEWVITFASSKNPLAQADILDNQGKPVVDNERILSIEVPYVDKIYKKQKKLI